MPIRPRANKESWVKQPKLTNDNWSRNNLYHSQAWRRDRNNHIMLNPLCVYCEAKGISKTATVSDHIRPISQGGEVWDWSNRQALCTECHNSKSASEGNSRRKIVK